MDCGGGRKERGLEMEIVVRGITRESPCFECERTTLSSRLYSGGPVQRFLRMAMRRNKISLRRT